MHRVAWIEWAVGTTEDHARLEGPFGDRSNRGDGDAGDASRGVRGGVLNGWKGTGEGAGCVGPVGLATGAMGVVGGLTELGGIGDTEK